MTIFRIVAIANADNAANVYNGWIFGILWILATANMIEYLGKQSKYLWRVREYHLKMDTGGKCITGT